MTEKRKTYTAEFKQAAVKLIPEQGYSVAEAARSLDVSEKVLRKWKHARQAHGQHAFPGKGNLPADQEEIRTLRQENHRLRMERDILKKRRPSTPWSPCEILLHPGPQGHLACHRHG